MPPVQTRLANKLLQVLQPAAYGRVAAKLKPASLQAKQILYKPNQPIDRIYFPETAVICLMTLMSNGDTVETATVGVEGASWISASIGASSMPCETIVAISGDAHAIEVQDLDAEMQHNEHFRDVLTRYSHALLIHSMRMTGCTALHSLEKRCARWMLTTLDRVSQDRFAITQEFLAMLLGATRPAVSGVLQDMKRLGTIDIERGLVLIRHREQLLGNSCECYDIIKSNYQQVGR